MPGKYHTSIEKCKFLLSSSSGLSVEHKTVWTVSWIKDLTFTFSGKNQSHHKEQGYVSHSKCQMPRGNEA